MNAFLLFAKIRVIRGYLNAFEFLTANHAKLREGEEQEKLETGGGKNVAAFSLQVSALKSLFLLAFVRATGKDCGEFSTHVVNTGSGLYRLKTKCDVTRRIGNQNIFIRFARPFQFFRFY